MSRATFTHTLCDDMLRHHEAFERHGRAAASTCTVLYSNITTVQGSAMQQYSTLKKTERKKASKPRQPDYCRSSMHWVLHSVQRSVSEPVIGCKPFALNSHYTTLTRSRSARGNKAKDIVKADCNRSTDLSTAIHLPSFNKEIGQDNSPRHRNTAISTQSKKNQPATKIMKMSASQVLLQNENQMCSERTVCICNC
jgi:hypothetical protein